MTILKSRTIVLHCFNPATDIFCRLSDYFCHFFASDKDHFCPLTPGRNILLTLQPQTESIEGQIFINSKF